MPESVALPPADTADDTPVIIRGLPRTVRRPWSGPDHMLIDYLAMTVPLLMLEMSGISRRELVDRSRPLVDVITSTADNAMYGGPGCGHAAAEIARAAATLAMVAEGGITIMGLHWCLWESCDWCGRAA